MIDSLDRKIIAALTEDGRMPYSRIAEDLGVATTTVHQRVRRMVDRGVIVGTRVSLDWEAIGLGVTALVFVEAPRERPIARVAEDLKAIPYVSSCYTVTGEFDLLLTIRARSSEHLGELLEQLRSYSTGSSRTLVVLASHFEGRIPPTENGRNA